MNRSAILLSILPLLLVFPSCKEDGGSASDETQYNVSITMPAVSGREAPWKASPNAKTVYAIQDRKSVV